MDSWNAYFCHNINIQVCSKQTTEDAENLGICWSMWAGTRNTSMTWNGIRKLQTFTLGSDTIIDA